MEQKNIKTIDFKGKPYVEVNERIKYFREHFKGYSLLTEVVYRTETEICLKAKVINESGVEVSNGLAMEKEGSNFVNKTSYIENCETSAWGRALGNFGIGIDSSVCSADELLNAVNNEDKKSGKKTQKRKPKLSHDRFEQAIDKIGSGDYTKDELRNNFDLTPDQLKTLNKI